MNPAVDMNSWGPWTVKQKLKCVREYLHAYTTIMRKQPFQICFTFRCIFAGTKDTEKSQGKREDPDQMFHGSWFFILNYDPSQFHDGSARNTIINWKVEPFRL